jgi:hypothetical protein
MLRIASAAAAPAAAAASTPFIAVEGALVGARKRA